MQSEPAPDLGREAGPAREFRRHPASILFSVGSMARRWIVPWLIAFLLSPGRRGADFWAMFLVVPAAAGALLEYLLVRYQLGRDDLVVRKGLFFRNERHIPYGRIQNLDLLQNPFHRLLGVAEVRVETASGEEAEATIRVLSLERVEEMRRRVAAWRALSVPAGPLEPRAGETGVGAGPASQVILEVPARELVLLGVISNRGLVVAAAIGGLLWQLWEPGDTAAWRRFRPWELLSSLRPRAWIAQAGLAGWAGSLLTLLAALVVVLIVVRLFSVVWTLVKLYGFRLQRVEGDLRTTCGLFTRTSSTIPRHRIHVLSITRSFLHRRFGRATVQAHTAGRHPGEEESAAERRQLLVPIVADAQLASLLAEVHPDLDVAHAVWLPVSPRASGRILKKWLSASLIVTAWACLYARWWGTVVLLLLVPLSFVNARLQVRHLGYALTEQAVLSKRGWWTRVVRIARYSKVQAVALRESPFDRRSRMARIGVDTAAKGGGIEVPYLEADAAKALLERIEREAAGTTFRW